MQRATIEMPADLSEMDPNPLFSVVIAYEDFETGKHAKRVYDFLVEHLGQECQFSNQMWKFDVLGLPKLREMAADDAAKADIIIVSCHGDSELPKHVFQWMDAWMAVNGTPVALVVLCDSEPASTCEVRARLAEVARRAGIEFFAQPDEWPGRSRSLPQFEKSLNQADAKALSALVGAIERESTPRWEFSE